MEKERKIKTLSIVALIVAVLGLTVAFAALSTQLTISGTAEVTGGTDRWNILFQNLNKDVNSTGEIITEPTLTNTSITGFEVKFKKPGDYVTYTFDVKNAGEIDAKISEIIKAATPTCTSKASPAVPEDETKVCDHLEYTLTYSDGSEVKASDTLNAGAVSNMKLLLKYKDDVTAELLPTNDVSISDLDIKIKYNQK